MKLVTDIKVTPTVEEADVLHRTLWSAGALFVVDRIKWRLAGSELPQKPISLRSTLRARNENGDGKARSLAGFGAGLVLFKRLVGAAPGH